jgi:DNA-binding PadR family transcriptional regulator
MAKLRNRDINSFLPLSAAVFSILLALAGGEKHGYAIMKQVSLDEGGAVSMGPGTLYGSLDRMLRAGLVEETGLTDDDRRRYYRVTKFGSEVLSAETLRLSRAISAARRKGVLTEARP